MEYVVLGIQIRQSGLQEGFIWHCSSLHAKPHATAGHSPPYPATPHWVISSSRRGLVLSSGDGVIAISGPECHPALD